MIFLSVVLPLSLAGSVLAVPVLLLRPLVVRRLPAASMPALWALVLAAFLLPVTLPSPVSVWRLAAPAGVLRSMQAYTPENAEPGSVQTPDARDGRPAADAGGIAAGVWLAGALLSAGIYARRYRRLRRAVKSAAPLLDARCRTAPLLDARYGRYPGGLRRRVTVRVSDGVGCAVTFGIFRPVILLSPRLLSADERTVGHVLLHEMQHIRRFDSLWSLAFLGASCLHWFNPLVYLCRALAAKDRELFCDIRTVRQLGDAEKAGYARTILELTPVREPFSIVPGFGARPAAERIARVLSYRRAAARSWAALALLLIALPAFFMPGAQAARIVTISADDTAGNYVLLRVSDGEAGVAAQNRLRRERVSDARADGEAGVRYSPVGSFEAPESAALALGLTLSRSELCGFGYSEDGVTLSFSYQCIPFTHGGQQYLLLDRSTFRTGSPGLTSQSALDLVTDRVWDSPGEASL